MLTCLSLCNDRWLLQLSTLSVHRRGVRGLRRGSIWGPAHQVQDRGRIHRDTAPTIWCTSAAAWTDTSLSQSRLDHINHNHNNNNCNNNNNTIWGDSVLTGEEPPPHSGELQHALPRAGDPTQSQLSRPMSLGHHISIEHRLRRKHLLFEP